MNICESYDSLRWKITMETTGTNEMGHGFHSGKREITRVVSTQQTWWFTTMIIPKEVTSHPKWLYSMAYFDQNPHGPIIHDPPPMP